MSAARAIGTISPPASARWWDINDCWAVYGGVSQAFRAPNLNDLTGSTLSLGGLDSYGSPDLDPEKYVTAELGTRYGNETLSASLAAFYTWSRDAIISERSAAMPLRPMAAAASCMASKPKAVENQPVLVPQRHGGLERRQNRQPRHDGERWISRQLPFTGSLALRWTHPNERLWVEGRVLGCRHRGPRPSRRPGQRPQRIPTNGTPGYLVTSLRGGWPVNDHLELTCGIENITDEDYRNHGSGQNEPGLNGIIGARIIW
jgi:hemoglobin/transferrin/lactoferrin receptor protein